MGNNWDLIREKMHQFDLLIGALIIIFIALYLWRQIKHSRTA
jgi:hypothetical protein